MASAPGCTRDAKGASAAAHPGGRAAATITLAAGDVATVERGVIEDGTPVTGDLHPSENTVVRASLDGEIERIFVREGQPVSRTQLLARYAASVQEGNRASAEADRVAAEGELETARWNLEQTAQLFKAGAISERDYKAAAQAVAAARARDAAVAARVRAAAVASRNTRVVAPAAGIVDKRFVESGEHVVRGAPLFTVVRADVLELQASVPARRAGEVHVGQKVHFTADGHSFDGRVARVSPTIDPSTRSVTVYVQVANADGRLKGGTSATGRIIARRVAEAVVLPTPAIRQVQDDATRAFVYRIRRNTIDAVPVNVGVTDDDRGLTEVLSGVAPGERVVVGNVGTLGQGMQVQVMGTEARPAAPTVNGPGAPN